MGKGGFAGSRCTGNDVEGKLGQAAAKQCVQSWHAGLKFSNCNLVFHRGFSGENLSAAGSPQALRKRRWIKGSPISDTSKSARACSSASAAPRASVGERVRRSCCRAANRSPDDRKSPTAGRTNEERARWRLRTYNARQASSPTNALSSTDSAVRASTVAVAKALESASWPEPFSSARRIISLRIPDLICKISDRSSISTVQRQAACCSVGLAR